MRIYIRAEGHTFFIPIPTALIFSKPSAWIAGKTLEKYVPKEKVPLSARDIELLCAEIRKIRRCRGRWTLVQVESADGEKVKIVL